MPQAPKESGHSISSERTSTTSCRRLQRRTAVRWRSRCCSVGRRKRRSGPWTLGSELIANVVRVDHSTHVAAPANRQLRPHVLALLASSRRRLGGPIVRRLLRESLNAGHRHGSPNAWPPCNRIVPPITSFKASSGKRLLGEAWRPWVFWNAEGSVSRRRPSPCDYIRSSSRPSHTHRLLRSRRLRPTL